LVEKATEGKSNVEERRRENLNDVLGFLAVAREHSLTGLRRSLASGERSAETILWPVPAKLLPRYPDINVELIIDYGLTDTVAARCDAGLGEQVARNTERLFMARLSALRAFF
jgi:DNA-binding transcriptional LysR family regulator